MKRVTFIRHAKSSWEYPELSDLERPLNKRWERDAPRIWNFLHENKVCFDEMISSNSIRTQATADIISKKTAFQWDVHIISELYLWAWMEDYIGHIQKRRSDTESVAFFGHNETLRNLVMNLSQWKIREFPTCAVASFLYSWQWTEFSLESYPKLDIYMTPKWL